MDQENEHEMELKLALAWRDGDKSAERTLITRNTRLVHKMLTDSGLRRVRDDLSQDIWLELHRSIRHYRGGSFRGFLRAVARNVINRHLRRCYKGSGAFNERAASLTEVVEESYYELDFELGLDRNRLVAAFDQLPKHYRHCAIGYYVLGMTQAEIAEQLRTERSRVNGNIARARAELRRRLCPIEAEVSINGVA